VRGRSELNRRVQSNCAVVVVDVGVGGGKFVEKQKDNKLWDEVDA
jgi:hypothetical protein